VKSVEVGGVRLAYRTAGDPEHPPMVLLHGLGESSAGWEVVLPGLARRHFVYALDLRGHGQSAHPGQYSFELMRDDVAGFLAALGITKCVLVGHSMGGVVGILLARALPGVLTHLILEDVSAPRPGALPRPPLSPPDEPTEFDFAAVNAIRAQINSPDPGWWSGQAEIAVPTLIVGGASSGIPGYLLAETVAMMPNARLVTLEAGHDVHEERPAEFVAVLDGFLG
jgi:esterase